MYHRLSDLHDMDQISRGGPFWPVLGDHFSTENFGPGGSKFSGPKFQWQLWIDIGAFRAFRWYDMQLDYTLF